jgi:hypothetical protein
MLTFIAVVSAEQPEVERMEISWFRVRVRLSDDACFVCAHD